MTEFLTTEELLQALNKQFPNEGKNYHTNENVDLKSELQQELKRNKLIFLAVSVLILFHIIYLVLPLVLPDNGLSLYGMSNLLAVPIDQEVVIDDGSFEVFAAVIVVEKFDKSKLDKDDLVVIYGKFGSDVYWVERVVDFDLEANTVTTSVDGYFESNDVTSLDQVRGYFVRMAGTTGALAYVTSNFRGFTLVVLVELIIIYSLYLVLIDRLKRKISEFESLKAIDKENFNESDDTNDVNKPDES